MYQVIEREVVINREENPGFAIDAMTKIPLNLEILGDGVSEGQNQTRN